MLDATGWGQGVCAGDYDNDGWQDLYVTYYGANRLYHNEHGVFKLVSEKAGVKGKARSGARVVRSSITIATASSICLLPTMLILM